ncbi:MAG: hypothetical protein US58_C0026G0012 [Candidatus Magasanikbacteria bacterium GW2011_GWA2_37_8]|uniref:Host attachment protein n=1 Tax=Candidatus Magasanikbacteria bacterium GW2011_GWA2_37_8 TaxID=1619036 RepID=A0A0G0KH31_9BACT|nr:MAG: hypothetical protein US58_C0026G0012 [Candidatus Magasanikbacteria bacterium GW2011_GWA2_37_8]
MKIPSILLQFKNKTGLILVTGTEEANFFIARDTVISNIFHFRLEKTKFSDREDSARRGLVAFETGSKIEQLKKLAKQDFIKNFKEATKKLVVEQKVDVVYLFAPSSIIKELEKALPAVLKKKLVKTHAGNFCKESVLKILKKI